MDSKQKEWDIGSLEIIKDAYAIRNRVKMRLLKYVLSRMTAKLGCTSYIIIRTLQDITGENNDIINT